MKRWSKGVISGVPADTTDDEVKEETSAVMVRRITRMVDCEIIPTRSVIIAFEDKLPREVFVHRRRYRVELHVPKPIRCNKCQAFGHKTASCEATTAVCSRCSSKKHDYTSCPVDKEHAKCANFGKYHNAAYKGCFKYRTIDRALNISVKQGISYRDAVTQVKKTYGGENAVDINLGRRHSTNGESEGSQESDLCRRQRDKDDQVGASVQENRSNRRQSKEGDFGESNTDVGVRGKQFSLWSYISIHDRRPAMRSNAVSHNYNGNNIIVGSPKHTTDKRSTPSRQPTQGSSEHHQKLKMKTSKQLAVAEEKTQQQVTTTPTMHGRTGAPTDVNDANDEAKQRHSKTSTDMAVRLLLQ